MRRNGRPSRDLELEYHLTYTTSIFCSVVSNDTVLDHHGSLVVIHTTSPTTCCIPCDVGVVHLKRSFGGAIHTTSIPTCCIREEDTRGGVQGTAGAGHVDGSTTVTRHTPTRLVQPFQRQRPTRVDIKMPPIPARLRSNCRQTRTSSDRQITRETHPRTRHRAVVRAREGPSGLGRRSRPNLCHLRNF